MSQAPPHAATLNSLLDDWRKLLRRWAQAGALDEAAQQAMRLVGVPPGLTELSNRLAEADFSDLPPVDLVPPSAMPGAAGAYAISTGTIYLNSGWLATASRDQILAVLTEELGHHLDGLLNATDTPGDEGELFSALLTAAIPNSPAHQLQLMGENNKGLDEFRCHRKQDDNIPHYIADGAASILASVFDPAFVNEQGVPFDANDDSGVIQINGMIITIEQAADSLSQNQVTQLKEGLTRVLSAVHENIGRQVFAEQFPLIGNNLKDAFDTGSTSLHYVSTLQRAISSGLNSLTGSPSYSLTQAQTAINSALLQSGISGLGVTVVDTANGLRLEFDTKKNYTPVEIALESDIGLPNLGFRTSGFAKTSFDYGFNFDVGLDSSGFYVDTSPTGSQFQIKTSTIIPGFKAKADLALLSFTATDNQRDPSALIADFDLAFSDPDNNGKLRTTELTSGSSVLKATVQKGDANINLNLQSTLPSNVPLPQFGTNLNIQWSFNGANLNPADSNSTFGNIPAISFTDSYLDLRSFLDIIPGHFLNKISQYTAPIKPILDVLSTPIPLLSAGGSDKVALIDLLQVSKSQATAIKALTDIADLANKITAYGTSSGVRVDLGSLSLNGDLRSNKVADSLLSVTRALTASNHGSFINFQSDVKKVGGEGLRFPLLTDETAIGKLLLGQNVNLFDYRFPKFSFATSYEQFIPVLGPLGINLGGEVGIDFLLDVGFDTEGLRDFLASGATDPTKIANGFYLGAYGADGKPLSGADLHAGIIAGVAVKLLISQAGVDGDITADIAFRLNPDLADDDGKVRVNKLLSTSVADLFDLGGELSAGLRAYAEIGIGPISVDLSYESPRVILLSFNSYNEVPVLADHANSVLLLNTGPRSSLRQFGNTKDGPERFQLRVHEIPLIGPVIEIDAFNSKNFFFNADLIYTKGFLLSHLVSQLDIEVEIANFYFLQSDINLIKADGGSRSDELVADHDSNIRIDFRGGDGPDRLTGAANADLLSGEEGNDQLEGNGGNDILRGGSGSDKLIGGKGADVLDGGDGIDLASYRTADAGVLLDLATNQFTGDAAGDTFVSIEKYEGSNFADTFIGDSIANAYAGLDGNDTIFGFGGDDFLVGGSGSDSIDGGNGNDIVAYAESKQSVHVSLKTGIGKYGDAEGDTLINIEVLLGSLVSPAASAANSGDVLEGDDGMNTIAGLAGNDSISGLGGDDWLYGDAPGNWTYGGVPITSTTLAISANEADDADQDSIFGGEGNDHLFGQAGNDSLNGESGNDVLDGGEGHDFLDGGLGYDVLRAGNGNDHLYSFDLGSADFLDGENGSNRLSADYSDQTVDITFIAGRTNSYAFLNKDIALRFQSLGDFNTGSGNDRIVLDGDADDGFKNTLKSNAGQDTINSGAGEDSIDAGPGIDLIDGGVGADLIDGGDGFDTVDYSKSPNNVFVDLKTGLTGGSIGAVRTYDQKTNSSRLIIGTAVSRTLSVTSENGSAMSSSAERLINIENIIGSNYNDHLVGSDEDNTFNPGLSRKLDSRTVTVNGTETVELFNQWITIKAGVVGPTSDDWVDGGAGNDLLIVDYSIGDDSSGGAMIGGGNAMVAGDGYFERRSAMPGQPIDQVRYTNFERLIVYGTSKNDRLYGGPGDDTLYGGLGSDFLVGGRTGNSNINGNDVIYAGEGDDEVSNRDYNFSDNDVNLFDRFDGGSGSDILSADFSNQTSALTFISGQSNDIVFSDGTYARNFEYLRNIKSGSGSDLIVQKERLPEAFGSATENRIFTGAGNDTINPGVGKDSIDGGDGDDLLILDYSLTDDATTGGMTGFAYGVGATGLRSNGSYTRRKVNGDSLDDLIAYNIERYHITGTSKADKFTGWQSNDVIIGLAGNDTLTGYGGNDQFIFSSGRPFSAADLGIDTITDFETGQDQLVLDLATFTAGSTFAEVPNDSEVAANSAFIVYSKTTGNLYYNQNGSSPGFGEGGQFLILSNRAALGSANLRIKPKLNTPLILNAINKTTLLNSELGFIALDFSNASSDSGPELLSRIRIASLPTNGILQLNGNSVIPGQQILTTELGNLSYTPNLNFAGLDKFNWIGLDPLGGISNLAAVNLTVNAPLITVVPSIVSMTDNEGAIQAQVDNGGLTDDTTITITGTISSVLTASESIRVYNGDDFLGSAIVDRITSGWSFTPTLPPTAGRVYSISARVADVAGNLGSPSAPWTFTLDTTSVPEESFIEAKVFGSVSLGSTPLGYALKKGGSMLPLQVTFPGGRASFGNPGTNWSAVVATAAAHGYSLYWRNSVSGQTARWELNTGGVYTGGTMLSLTQLLSEEASLNLDINGDGATAGPTTINGVNLASTNQGYALVSGSGSPIQITYDGTMASASRPGDGWRAIAATSDGNGYNLYWRNSGSGEVVLWDLNGGGAYTSGLYLSPAQLNNEEFNLNLDLNGDGFLAGAKTIDGINLGSTSLGYGIRNGGGSPIQITYGGTIASASRPGDGWGAIAATSDGNGYNLYWRNTSSGQTARWQLDRSGAYFSGYLLTSTQLLSEEAKLNLDLNGDGYTSGPTTIDGVNLGSTADGYALRDGAGPALQVTYPSGNAAASNPGNGWSAVAAARTSGGYFLYWSNSGSGQAVRWQLDGSGSYVTGNYLLPAELISEEARLNLDLNGDGYTSGPTTINAVNLGSTADGYALRLGSGETLQVSFAAGNASANNPGNGWRAVAATSSGDGYGFYWHNSGSGQTVRWQLDSNGAYSSGAFLSASQLIREEDDLNFDLNGDAIIGSSLTAIETLGNASLLRRGDGLAAVRVGGTVSPVSSPFGLGVGDSSSTWQMLAAETVGGQNQILWRNNPGNFLHVWNLDSSWNWQSSFGTINPSSIAGLGVESNFQLDLNGDGVIG